MPGALTKAEAKSRRKIIHDLLKKGHPPMGQRPRVGQPPGSIYEYAQAIGVSYRSAFEDCRRGGRLDRAGAPVDWDLYKPTQDELDRAKSLEAPPGIPEVAPPGFTNATSVLYDRDGNLKLFWQKSKVDATRSAEMVRQAVQAFTDDLKGLYKRPKAKPGPADADLLTCLMIGDAHLGMYAWAPEAGKDFDLNIAMDNTLAAARRLLAAVPPSEKILICQLGDFFHVDNTRPETFQSANPLDVDTRFHKMIRRGIHLLRAICEEALERHETVIIRNCAGNHDPHAHIALTEALYSFYSGEPRIKVADSPAAFWTYRFHNNLIGLTHGHQPKPDVLPDLMAVDAAKDWAHAEFKYAWHGHIHNKRVFERMGVLVESFRTISPNDAWHQSSGYRAGKEMQAIVLHKDDGEIERHTASLRRIERNPE